KASAHLDTALAYSSSYLPALLAYAELEAQRGNFEQAAKHVARAKEVDASYAPVNLTEANILHQQVLQEKMPPDQAIEEQQPLLSRAFEQETDFSIRAHINSTYRQRLYAYGRVPEAIETSERYLEDAPIVSTYLRDRKEQAMAYKYDLRSRLGYQEEAMAYFRDLVAQNPQNFGHRRSYADMLYRAGKLEQALEVLEEGQHILLSADESRPGYTLRIARLHAAMGDTTAAREKLSGIQLKNGSFDNRLMLAGVYIQLKDLGNSRSVLEEVSEPALAAPKAALRYTLAKQAAAEGNQKLAAEQYRRALEQNSYHYRARRELADLLRRRGEDEAASALRKEAGQLGLNI